MGIDTGLPRGAAVDDHDDGSSRFEEARARFREHAAQAGPRFHAWDAACDALVAAGVTRSLVALADNGDGSVTLLGRSPRLGEGASSCDAMTIPASAAPVAHRHRDGSPRVALRCTTARLRLVVCMAEPAHAPGVPELQLLLADVLWIADMLEHVSSRTSRASHALAALEDSFFEWNFDRRTFITTGALFEGLGYRRESLDDTIDTWNALLHPDEQGGPPEPIRSVIQGEVDRWAVEHRLRRADGTYAWILSRGSVADRDSQGRPLVAVGTLTDLSERRQIELALRESERRLAVAIEGSGDGLWDWQLKTGDVWFNERWATMLGYEPSEIEPSLETWQNLVHPDDLEPAMAAVNRLLAGESARYEFEHRLRRKDGTWAWVLDRGTVVERDEDGSPLRAAGTHTDISTRRAAEVELREAHLALERLMDTMHDGVIRFDAAGRVLSINRRAAQVLGVTVDEALGRGPAEAAWALLDEHGVELPPEAHPSAIVRATGEPIFDGLIGMRRADGTITWVTENVVPGARDEHGRVVESVVSFADVTRIREAMALASDSEARLRQVLETQTDAVWVLDNGRIEWANPAMARIFGQPLEELLGQQIAALVEPTEVADLRSRLAALDAGEAQSSVRRIVRPDGEVRWIEVRAHPLGLGRSQAVARDVTERKELEAERERLLRAIDRSFDAIEVTGRDGAIAYVNSAFEQLVGRAREDLIGLNGHFYLAGQDRTTIEAEVGQALLGPGSWAGDLEVARADRSKVTAAFRVARVDAADGSVLGFIATARDVTYERKLEAQLAEAARVESIGQLAGGVAHDFNNILTAVLGHAELAAMEAGTGAVSEDLREITRAARRAQTLTRQLLAFGRRSILQPRNVSLGEVAEALAPMLRRLIGEDVTLLVEREPEPGPVHVDPSLLEHAITNLVVNARDAMPTGGTIRVVTGTAADGHDGNARASLRVIDEGVGMEPDVAARIFEPFFTTKEVGKGTGLGLAMVQGFVAQSGGSLEVDTSPGAGTMITIFLSVTDGVATDRAEPSPDSRAGNGAILVVEDEPMLRSIADRVLRRAGYDVTLAASPADALEVLHDSTRTIDLLFTDVVMPGMTGPELASLATAGRPGLRVLMTSGYTDYEFDRRGLSLNSAAFLAKPYEADQLLDAIAASLSPAAVPPA